MDMNDAVGQMEPNPEIIAAVRESAAKGASIREMVAEIRSRLVGVDDPTFLVLWYLMKAFSLRLTEALPVRDWLAGLTNDDEIDSLILPRINGTRGKWSLDSDGSEDQPPVEAKGPAHGLPVAEQRS